ncbi:MAG TPA: AI-2E family transporter YdiK [Burkholderiales bacterium]|nr:AI-2E family transporter YdiK [Burkholderiales bacterium]
MNAGDIEMGATQPVVVTTVAVQPPAVQPGTPPPAVASDLPRATISVVFMALLGGAALWILRPFVPAIVWATMIVVAMWPLMLKAQAKLGGRRWAAVCAMTASMLLAFVVPFSLALTVIVSHSEDIGEWAESLREVRVPAAPTWVAEVPFVGPRVAKPWDELSAASPAELAGRLEPHARTVAAWLLAQVGSVTLLIGQFLLTVIVAAILFAKGEEAAAGVIVFFRRLAGTQGEKVVLLAGNAIRGVALGVVLTALIQSVLAGAGLAIAGLPFPGLLTAFMFMLAVAQIGPGPVLVPAVIWYFYTSDATVAPFVLLAWCVFVGVIDNVIRPILIQRGGDMPLLMVFAGVVGGLLSFGLIGIFLGPVVLAVVYTLLKAWVAADPRIRPPEAAAAAAAGEDDKP